MRRLTLAVLIIVAICCAAVPAVAQDRASDNRPGIAVLPFDNGGSYGDKKENYDLLPVGLQQSLMYELVQNTNLRIVDRSRIRELLAEQDLGASGRVSAETAARIGRAVGARYVITGGFMDLNGEFVLTGNVVDVETTEVLKGAQARGKRDKMYDLIVDLAGRVVANVNLPALPTQAREARKERNITPEAMVRHAMILSLRDEGKTERAVQLLNDLVKEFPQVEEWKAELRQVSGG